MSQAVRSFMQACMMNPSSPEEFGTQVATTVIGTSPRDWDDHSVLRHLARLEETARAFRRVADLGRARASFASGDRSFDAYAVTMTAADGKTLDATVTLVGDERDAVTAALDTALNELAHLGARGREALLAALAASNDGASDTGHSVTAVGAPERCGGRQMSESIRHICGISGGKDSSAMAVYLRQHRPELEVEYFFCDTGAELPETYEYLSKLEAVLGKPIARLNADRGFDHWFEVYRGALPSPQMRWCTSR